MVYRHRDVEKSETRRKKIVARFDPFYDAIDRTIERFEDKDKVFRSYTHELARLKQRVANIEKWVIGNFSTVYR